MQRKIAVCDDEKLVLRQISQYLDQYVRETGEQLTPFYYASGEELLVHMPRDIHAVLLDISMGELSGMDCARRLRIEGFRGAIFFLTSMTGYALEGYDVHAFAFLPKPVTYGELKIRLAECFSAQDAQRPAVLSLVAKGRVELLPVEDILCVEVIQHDTSFTLRGGTRLTAPMKLAEVESKLGKLAPGAFFRCHRSYLVNLRAVRRIWAAELALEGELRIPLSRHRQREFLDAYAGYMGVLLP